jgi:hypothetical protein
VLVLLVFLVPLELRALVPLALLIPLVLLVLATSTASASAASAPSTTSATSTSTTLATSIASASAPWFLAPYGGGDFLHMSTGFLMKMQCSTIQLAPQNAHVFNIS